MQCTCVLARRAAHCEQGREQQQESGCEPERIHRLRSVTLPSVAAWNTVPSGSPHMMASIACNFLLLQMAILQPAAVTILAAVSLVAMPPVPHAVPLVDVSTASFAMSCTSCTQPPCPTTANRSGNFRVCGEHSSSAHHGWRKQGISSGFEEMSVTGASLFSKLQQKDQHWRNLHLQEAGAAGEASA